MEVIASLLKKHEEYEEARAVLDALKRENRDIKTADNELFVKKSFVNDEIREKRRAAAKKIVAEIGPGRFSYDLDSYEVDAGHPWLDITNTIHRSNAFIHIMGLKFPVGSRATGTLKGKIVPVEDLMVEGIFESKAYMEGLVKKFKVDPEGTRSAVCESVRVRMMKERTSIPVELESVNKKLAEAKERLKTLEKLVAEEVPDNAIMRMLFKKKFAEREKAPKEIEELKKQIGELETNKENLEYRLKVAESLSTKEQIEKYVDEEIEFLMAFAARDWAKEVGETSLDLVAEANGIELQREELNKGIKSTRDQEAKVDSLKRAFESDFASIESYFGNKEFVDELKSIDVTKLSEEERKIVEVIREQYDKYLARAISQYEPH